MKPFCDFSLLNGPRGRRPSIQAWKRRYEFETSSVNICTLTAIYRAILAYCQILEVEKNRPPKMKQMTP
jgi:hypothetical protein